MIRLFKNTETDFTHNGVHVLDDIVIGDTCTLLNGINETYSLEMEVAIFDNDKWKSIGTEMFLRVPSSDGEQIFRIKEVVQGFSTLKIYAKHVFYDLENNFIIDTNVVQKDGRSALSQILGAMSNNMINTYYSSSDISKVNNSRLVRKNVVTALLGSDDNSFINRWGGELELNNFNFAINTRIGQDRGFTIRYGKNCTGYEGNINTYNLCTRIVPVGFNGITLEENWVDSPNITMYPQIYTQEIKYENIKLKENPDDEEGYDTIEEARIALKQAALDTFTNTKCDLPIFSARVNFITLQNTIEYEDIQALECVGLGDDVYIYLSNIGVTATSRVVRTKYNFYTNKYIEVEIGEVKPNFFKQLVSIKDAIDLVTEQLEGNTWQDIINKSLDEATKLMQEGLKDSYVITMKNQIVIGDDPDINNMVNCIVMNKSGIGFSNNGYLPDQLISAMTIDGKINASCITTGQLNAALIKAGTLMSVDGTTYINLDNGYFNLKDKVKYDSNGFYMDITDSKNYTDNAIAGAKTQIKVTTDGLTTKVTSVENNLSTTNNNVSNLTSRVSTAESSITQTASSISTKVEKNGVISAINQTAESATISASKINLNGYVTISSLSGSGTTTINADNITTGSISASRISAGTLSGCSISSGSYVNTYYANFSECNSAPIFNNNIEVKGQFNAGYVGSLGNMACVGTLTTKNLSTTGSKNCVHKTQNYGYRKINAYETAEYYFGDLGEATILDNGEIEILIDPIMLEVINTDIQYHVFTSIYFGKITKLERLKDRFIVYGEPNTNFSWEIKAKRRGYENIRLEEDTEILEIGGNNIGK